MYASMGPAWCIFFVSLLPHHLHSSFAHFLPSVFASDEMRKEESDRKDTFHIKREWMLKNREICNEIIWKQDWFPVELTTQKSIFANICTISFLSQIKHYSQLYVLFSFFFTLVFFVPYFSRCISIWITIVPLSSNIEILC